MSDRSTPPSLELEPAMDAQPSAEEAALAEQLARSLASARATPESRDAPEDLARVLETAALVRLSQGPELAKTRQAALRSELSQLWSEPADSRKAVAARSGSNVVRLARWVPLLAAAGAALFLGVREQSSSAPQAALEAPQAEALSTEVRSEPVADAEEEAVLPRPSERLLRAQTDLVEASVQAEQAPRQQELARLTFERELGSYRDAWLEGLKGEP